MSDSSPKQLQWDEQWCLILGNDWPAAYFTKEVNPSIALAKSGLTSLVKWAWSLVSRKLEIDISFAFHCNLCMFPHMWCCSASMLWFLFIGCPLATVMYNMMRLWLGRAFHVTGPLWGESTDDGGFPSQRSSNMGFEVFVDVSLNKLLKKQLSCWWFHMAWCWYDTTVMAEIIGL